MGILVQIEHVDGQVADGAHELLAMARSLGGTVEALVCAKDATTVAAIADELDADTVVAVADAVLADYVPAAYLTCLAQAMEDRAPDLVLLSYSTAGIDLAGGVALKSGREMVCYATAIERDGAVLTVKSQVYSGKLTASTTLPLPGIVVVMPGAIKAPERAGGSAPVEELVVDLSVSQSIRHVENLLPDSDGIDLTKAERIVCVGRALGGTDKLPLAEALAVKLGAEIAGSRPVIDAGWLPRARQVGKSGTKVKPKLYLMAGVSGSPEHLEGMQDSDLIIALNSDEQAPIFGKAHYGAVCDMFEVLPALTEKLG